ncbi:MAG: transglycosylase domain-containing protein, partial [Bacilli bacterium]
SCIKNEYASYVTLENISDEMKQTLIVSEDKSFYKHSGFDVKRIIKALVNNITSLSIKEGASTITQQLARTIYLSNEKTLSRKVKEALITKKIEQNYTKNEILELYLNSVYFGHNLYGIEAASSYYFDTPPSSLDYAQSALLVGILKSPNNYAPDIDEEAAKKQKNNVLYSLYKEGIIDVNTYYEELQKKLNFSFKSKEKDSFLYYYDSCINEAKKYVNESTYKKGLNFYSYLDKRVQSIVEEIVKKHSNPYDEIGVVIMKPNSSKVISLVGGKDYSLSSYNRSIFSSKQIGSTIKPFIYSIALENGFTPVTKLRSEKTTFNIDEIGEYSPRNVGDRYANRDITMVEALSLSDNIYSSKVTLLLGSKFIASKLKEIGIEVENINPTIALGTVEMSLLELTSIYNAFASKGTYYYPSFFKELKTSTGNLLLKGKSKKIKLFQEDTAIKMSYMLRSPFDKAFLSYMTPSLLYYEPSVTFAAKTGSTTSSSYVVGYNSKYTIGIYVGNDENKEVYDKKLAKVLFKEIVSSIIKKDENVFFTPSSSLKPFSILNTKSNQKSFTYYK